MSDQPHYLTNEASLRAAIGQQLTTLARDAFDDDSLVLTSQTSAAEVPGWDSFSHMTFIVAVEQEFAITFETAELENMRNAGDLASTILHKLTAADTPS